MAQANIHPPAPGTQATQQTNTLLIVLIVVGAFIFVMIAVVGVMAALAIYGTRRYITQAKRAEAISVLEAMARGFEGCTSGALPPPTGSVEDSVSTAGLPPTTTPVPASLSAVSGMKYMSAPADWDQPAWKCMGFQMRDPQYFQYQWERSSDTTGVLRARADLDGDGAAEITLELPVSCARGGSTLRCNAAGAPMEK